MLSCNIKIQCKRNATGTGLTLPAQHTFLTSPDPGVKHGPLVTIQLNVAVFSGIRQFRYEIEIIDVVEAH